MIPLKMGIPNLGVYYVSLTSYKDCHPTSYWQGFFFSGFTHHNGKDFLFYTCKQLHGLLPYHYWQGFFPLVISSVTSNEAKNAPT